MSADTAARLLQLAKDSIKIERNPLTSEIAEKLKEGNHGLLLDLVAKASLTPTDCRSVLAECASTPVLRAHCCKSIEYLIHRADAELFRPDESGDTLAQLAARNGNLTLLALLPEKVKFHSNGSGFTPFMEAAKHGRTRCAKHLMHRFRQKSLTGSWKAQLCVKNSNGESALDIAKLSGFPELAKLIEGELKLIENGLTLEQEQIRDQLEQLALAGNVAELKLLATSSACDLPDGGGKTVLMRVAECQSAGLEVLKLLANIGDPTAPDANGWAGLHSAAAAGWEGATRVLVDSGAAVNSADQRNWTALMQAASRDHVDCVKGLLRLGANWELQDCSGGTALYWADRHCCRLTSKLLCQFQDKSFFQEKQAVLLLASTDSAAPSTGSKLPSIFPQSNPARCPEISGGSHVGDIRNLCENSDTNSAKAAAPAASAPADQTGTDPTIRVECKSELRRIRFGDVIGRGTFGSVCQATVPGCPTEYCAKLIELPYHEGECGNTRNQKVKDAIAAELNLIQLKHKNIVKFIELCYNDKELQITVIMERVYGKTLTDFLQGKSINVNTNRKLTRQICDALQYMHSMQVVHRDLNGHNILIDENENAKLIDFGLSRRLHASDTHCIESSTMPKGTLHFLAPERFGYSDDSGRICPKSDVWALGCVVYFMATGTVPYENHKNFVSLGMKIAQFGAPSLPSPCDRDMADFYAQCTEKEFSKRKSAADLLEHPFLQQDLSESPSTESQQQNKDHQGGSDEEGRSEADPGDENSDPSAGEEADGHTQVFSTGRVSGSQRATDAAPSQDVSDIKDNSNLQLTFFSQENSKESQAEVPLLLGSSTIQDTNRYRVTSPRGLCLIINVMQFARNTLLEEREGSSLDVERITKLFSSLKFNVRLHENPTSAGILETIHEASAEPQLQSVGCFICFIMSHGSSGQVYGSDGQPVHLYSVMQPLKSVYCPNLRDKPKIVIFQSCRGSTAEGMEADAMKPQPSFGAPERDFLVCYSSTNGGAAFRDPDRGSPFVQTLCDVIENFRYDELTSIIVRVNRELMTTQASVRTGIHRFNVSEYVSTLTRKFYLDSNAEADDS